MVFADRYLTVEVRANDVDRVLNEENKRQGVKAAAMPAASDLAFLRRIYVDMISRIPTEAEIREFESWPADSRRERIIVKLMDDPRFIDRWTVFFEDMLRLRTNAAGGAALITFVHQAVADNLPYDELCRRRRLVSFWATTPIRWRWPA